MDCVDTANRNTLIASRIYGRLCYGIDGDLEIVEVRIGRHHSSTNHDRALRIHFQFSQAPFPIATALIRQHTIRALLHENNFCVTQFSRDQTLSWGPKPFSSLRAKPLRNGDNFFHVHVLPDDTTAFICYSSYSWSVRWYEGATDCYSFGFSSDHTPPRPSARQSLHNPLARPLWDHQNSGCL